MNASFRTAKFIRSEVAHLWKVHSHPKNVHEPIESLCGRLSVGSLEELNDQDIDHPACKACCMNGDIILQFSELSLLQRKVLELLGSNESFTRKEIKESIGIKITSTLTRILKRLDSYGLIEYPCEENSDIRITNKGLELLDQEESEEDSSADECIVLNSGIQGTVDSLKDEIKSNTNTIVHDDFDWVKSISLEYVARLKGESNLDKIQVYSKAAYAVSMVYYNLQFMEPVEVE